AARTSALGLVRGPLEGGADLVGLELGDRALVAFGGVPAALAESAGDHDRSPLERESARCSAWPRHTLTLKKLVSPSRHWPSCWTLWVTATRRLVTAMPVLVKRTSGSSTRLPMMVVWLSAAMLLLLRAGG